MVKLLMQRGADVTIRDVTLKSVVHAAVGDHKSMEALLQVSCHGDSSNDRQRMYTLPCPSDRNEVETSAVPNGKGGFFNAQRIFLLTVAANFQTSPTESVFFLEA